MSSKAFFWRRYSLDDTIRLSSHLHVHKHKEKVDQQKEPGEKGEAVDFHVFEAAEAAAELSALNSV